MSELDFNPGGSSDDTDIVSDASSTKGGGEIQDVTDKQDIVQEDISEQDVSQPTTESEPKDELDEVSTELENIRLEITQKSFLKDTKKGELDETIKGIPEEKKWLVKQTRSFNEERKERESQGLQETRALLEKNVSKRRNLFNRKSLEREKEYLEKYCFEDEESLKSADACIKGSSLNDEIFQLEKELDDLRKRERELKDEKIGILVSRYDELLGDDDIFVDKGKQGEALNYGKELIAEGEDYMFYKIGKAINDNEESIDFLASIILENPSHPKLSDFESSSTIISSEIKARIYDRVFEKGGADILNRLSENLKLTDYDLFHSPKIAANIFREDSERAINLFDEFISKGELYARRDLLAGEFGQELFRANKEKFKEYFLSLHLHERGVVLIGETGEEILSSSKEDFFDMLGFKTISGMGEEYDGKVTYPEYVPRVLASHIGLKIFSEDEQGFLNVIQKLRDPDITEVISNMGSELIERDFNNFEELVNRLDERAKGGILSSPFGSVLIDKYETYYIDLLSEIKSPYNIGKVLASDSGIKMFSKKREMYLDLLRGEINPSDRKEVLNRIGEVLFAEQRREFLNQYKQISDEYKASILIQDWTLELLQNNPSEYIELLIPLGMYEFGLVIEGIRKSDKVTNKEILIQDETISNRFQKLLVMDSRIDSEFSLTSSILDKYVNTFKLNREEVFSYLIADIKRRYLGLNTSRTEVEEIPTMIRSLVVSYPYNGNQTEKFLWNELVRELPFEGDSTIMGEMRQLALDVEAYDLDKKRLQWVHESVHNYADIRELPYLISFRKLLISATEEEFIQNIDVFDKYRAYYEGLPKAPDYQMQEILELQQKEGLVATLDNLISKVEGFYFGGNDSLKVLLNSVGNDLDPDLVKSSKELLFVLDNFDKKVEISRSSSEAEKVTPESIFQSLDRINDVRERILHKLNPSGSVELNEVLLKLSVNLDSKYRSVLTHGKSWLEELQGSQEVSLEQKRMASLLLLETLRAGEISGEFPPLGEGTLKIKEAIEKGSFGAEEFKNAIALSLMKRNIQIGDSWKSLVREVDKNMTSFLSDKYPTGMDFREIDTLVKMNFLVDIEKKSLLYNYQPIYSSVMDVLQKGNSSVVRKDLDSEAQESAEKLYNNEVRGSEEVVSNPEVIKFTDSLKRVTNTEGSSLEDTNQELTALYNLEEAHTDRILQSLDLFGYRDNREKISLVDENERVEILPVEYNGVNMAVVLKNGERVVAPLQYLKGLIQQQGYSGDVEKIIRYTQREGE